MQALLLLVPVLVLAFPAFLAGDVIPQATGVGFVGLALLPAALAMVFRRAVPSVRGLWFLLVPILVAVAWLASDGLTDTFEASRVLLQWITALACVLCGATLSARGRSFLVRGAIVLSLAFALVALFDSEHAFTGALGNTGNVSEAALAGAVAGAALAACGRGAWRILGLITFVVFLLFTARVPVLAGSVASAAGIVALVAAQRGRARPIAVGMCVLALIAFVIPFTGRGDANEGSAERADTSVVESKAGGVGVRFLIWKGSAAMSLAHPLSGVGTGQFAAAFPAWRDPREIERTTHGRRIAEETEVEHPHNDWLAPWLELGWIAGVAWAVFLGTVGLCAWRTLRRGAGHEVGIEVDAHDLALGAAGLALLVNALVRGPLLQNPASSVLAFSVFGTLLARDEVGPGRFARRLLPLRIVPIGSVLLLLVATPRALAFVKHGFALQRLVASEGEIDKVQYADADALAACPDSVLALSWSARIAEALHRGNAVVEEEWRRVLALRPLRIEALIQAGNHLRDDDPERAQVLYQRVLVLDARHPAALLDMGTLELDAGHPREGLASIDLLPAHRVPSRAWFEELAARLALSGVDDSAEAVFVRVDPALADPTAEQCIGRATEARKANRPPIVGDAWEARAHMRWARAHAAAGNYADAVRSYRQAVRLCTTHVVAPRRVYLELAAALSLSGKPDEARKQAGNLVPTPEDLAALPDWAAAPLRAGFEQDKK